jgi:integrase/recombinase XerD
MSNYLDPYRRHLTDCPHAPKGRDYSLCSCPIWVYGRLNGAPYRRSLQTTDWPRAQRRLDLLLNSAGDPDAILPAANARTIAAAVQQYLADCRARQLAAASLHSYTRTLTYFAAFAGARPLTALTVDLLSAFRDQRIAVDPDTAKPRTGPRTQRKEIEYLRTFCAWCVDREYLRANPAKKLKPPKVEGIATKPLEPDDIQKLIAACDRMRGMWQEDTPLVRQRARALVLLLLYSGLRCGDCVHLKRTKLRATGHLVLRTEKNGVDVKVLLHPDAVRALQALPAPCGNPTYFFWSGNGDPDDCKKSLWRTIQRVGNVAHVHAHPHRFRDTFAVELITAGADLRTVQKLLGHKSLKTTEQHYAHFVPAHQQLLDSATSALDFSRDKASRPLLVHTPQRRLRNS